MRICYFGGSFDPPHRGHLRVASVAAAAFRLDRILFVPTSVQPLKAHIPVASYQDRVAMVSLLCADAPTGTDFTLSELERPKTDGTPHYTVDSLADLRSSLHERDALFVLVGADSFLDLRLWRRPEELLRMAEWLVISRPGFSLAKSNALHPTPQEMARIHLLETVHDPTSSTLIRAELAAGKACNSVLTQAVSEYIYAHQLYGT